MAITSALLSVPSVAPARPRASAARPPRAANWWAPIFGWPAESDSAARPDAAPAAEEAEARRRRAVVFTEEKARKLRMTMLETSTFHDAMYHSAIASRLASDFKGRDGPRI